MSLNSFGASGSFQIGLPKADEGSLDAQLKALTARLDHPFVDLALALRAAPNSDPESRAVRDLGWVFARIVVDLQATVSRLLDPGGLAGYIARLAFVRGGFTGSPQ